MVKRLISRFASQGFRASVGRITAIVGETAQPRVVLIGRLSLFGPEARVGLLARIAAGDESSLLRAPMMMKLYSADLSPYSARVRMLARLSDIYIINNMFTLSRQTGALRRQTPIPARNNAVSEQLVVEVVRNLKALDRFIGNEGFACCGRITLADCALVPELFFVENVMPVIGVDAPIPAIANVAAYWAAIQKNEHAANVLTVLHRGLEERREMIRSGGIERFRDAAAEAQKPEDAKN